MRSARGDGDLTTPESIAQKEMKPSELKREQDGFVAKLGVNRPK